MSHHPANIVIQVIKVSVHFPAFVRMLLSISGILAGTENVDLITLYIKLRSLHRSSQLFPCVLRTLILLENMWDVKLRSKLLYFVLHCTKEARIHVEMKAGDMT